MILHHDFFTSAILLHRRGRHLRCDQTNGAQFMRLYTNVINLFDY